MDFSGGANASAGAAQSAYVVVAKSDGGRSPRAFKTARTPQGSVMTLRTLAGKHVVRAAVWAYRLAGLQHVQEHARVTRPQRRARRRAVQRQILGRDDDGVGLVGGFNHVAILGTWKSDVGEPVRIFRRTAIDHIEEAGLDLLGDRPALALADLAVVELADRGDFGGGAGVEGFVGELDVDARKAHGADLVAELARACVHRVAGDAGQRRGDIGVLDAAGF